MEGAEKKRRKKVEEEKKDPGTMSVKAKGRNGPLWQAGSLQQSQISGWVSATPAMSHALFPASLRSRRLFWYIFWIGEIVGFSYPRTDCDWDCCPKARIKGAPPPEPR